MTESEKKKLIKSIAGDKWYLELYLMDSCNMNNRLTIRRARENVKNKNKRVY